ncbi:Fumarate reductase flavoprotein subunit (EC 1.3.99.1) [Azospirillum palustre]
MLEKHTELRGSTGLSIGSNTATNTPHQRRAGIVDDPQAHFEDMGKFAGETAAADNEELRRILVENVPASVEWLMSLGVTFHGPMPEPPHRQPRMHNVLPNSRAYIYFVGREARRVGVDARVNATVERLLVENGRVVGVAARIDGRPHELRARRAVILATGDYSSSPDLKRRFNPAVAEVDGVNTTNVGDGHRFGEELGAEVKFGEVVYGPNLRFMPPAKPSALLRLPPHRLLTGAMRMALEKLPISRTTNGHGRTSTTAAGLSKNWRPPWGCPPRHWPRRSPPGMPRPAGGHRSARGRSMRWARSKAGSS